MQSACDGIAYHNGVGFYVRAVAAGNSVIAWVNSLECIEPDAAPVMVGAATGLMVADSGKKDSLWR